MELDKETRKRHLTMTANALVEAAVQAARVRTMGIYIDENDHFVRVSGQNRLATEEVFNSKIRREADLLLAMMTREVPEIEFSNNDESSD